MIDRDMLVRYVKIWEQYNNNPNFIFSQDEINFVNFIQKEAETDEKLSELLENLRTTSNRDFVIEQYFNPIVDNEIEENDYEVISNTFGVDVSNIEHRYLSNGKEIFCFYSMHTGRMVVLENKKEGISLVEQLKEIQAQNEIYQTLNDERNAQNILEDKNFKENCELNMIALDEIDENLNQVDELNFDDRQKLLFLIANANVFKIKYINIENIIGLDESGRVYETYFDSSNNLKIGEPNSANYNKESVDISDNMDSSYTVSEQNMALQSNYEDIPNEIEYVAEDSHLKFDDLPEEIQEKAILFYQFPDKLNELDYETRELWIGYVELYKKKLALEEDERNRKMNSAKIKRLVIDKKDGYINMIGLIFGVSIVILFISLMFLLLKIL